MVVALSATFMRGLTCPWQTPSTPSVARLNFSTPTAIVILDGTLCADESLQIRRVHGIALLKTLKHGPQGGRPGRPAVHLHAGE